MFSVESLSPHMFSMEILSPHLFSREHMERESWHGTDGYWIYTLPAFSFIQIEVLILKGLTDFITSNVTKKKHKSPVLLRNQVKATRITERFVSQGSGMLCLRVSWFEKRNSFKHSKYTQDQVWDDCFVPLLSLFKISFMFYLHPWLPGRTDKPYF